MSSNNLAWLCRNIQWTYLIFFFNSNYPRGEKNEYSGIVFIMDYFLTCICFIFYYFLLVINYFFIYISVVSIGRQCVGPQTYAAMHQLHPRPYVSGWEFSGKVHLIHVSERVWTERFCSCATQGAKTLEERWLSAGAQVKLYRINNQGFRWALQNITPRKYIST